MEASDALSAIHQCDSPEPSIVVVRRYTKTPYISWGTSQFLYLYVSTLPGNTSSAQFPLDHLHLWRSLPYSKTKVFFPHEEGEMGFQVYTHTWEVLWKNSKEEHHLSDPVLLLISSSTLLPHLEEGTQTEEEFGYNPALQQLQDFNQARINWNASWVRRLRSYLINMTIVESSWLGNKSRKWPKMTQEGNATFQEVFLRVSLTDSIKLLPWCVSSAIPLCYISEALVTAMLQGESAPSYHHCIQARGITCSRPLEQSSSSNWNSSSPSASLARSLLCRHSPCCVHPFSTKFVAGPWQIKWDCSPSASLGDHHDKRTCISFEEVEVKSGHNCAWGDEYMPKLVPEDKGRNLLAPLSVKPGPSLILMMVQLQEAHRVLGIKPHQTLTCPGRNMAEFWFGHSLWRDRVSCSDTEQVSIQSAHKKYQRRVRTPWKLSKGGLWTEAQLKRINDSCQDVWGHNHQSIR